MAKGGFGEAWGLFSLLLPGEAVTCVKAVKRVAQTHLWGNTAGATRELGKEKEVYNSFISYLVNLRRFIFLLKYFERS